MNEQNWQLEEPIDAIFFDCDSTLSQVEGIDILAQTNQVEAEVKILTETAMNQTGITPELYRQRLKLVLPTALQMQEIGKIYYQYLTPDADHVINLFKALGKKVYVISAGIRQSVVDFSARLGIPEEHVLAVDVYTDQIGNYLDFDHTSPLVDRNGKRVLIEQIKQDQRVLHMGDGMNDIEAQPIVDRFIGYGGVNFRQNIADLCQYYITSMSLTAMLPISLTFQEYQSLNGHHRQLYEQGLRLMSEGNILIRSEIMVK